MNSHGRRRHGGVALVAALLVLAATSALAAGTFLLVGIETALVRNRQELTLARAEAQTRLVSALLALESQAGDGRLPDASPDVEGVSEYRRIDEASGILSVVAEVGSARVETSARLILVEGGEGWRVHVPDRR